VTLNTIDNRALTNIAQKLGIPSKRLYVLINFESSFNPQAINKYSGAAGLIQFMPATARDMGFYSQYDLINKYPTIKSQLEGPVYNYLLRYKPYVNAQSLFMAVFFPRARTWPGFKAFPDYVKKGNPGINTPNDYIAKAYRRSGLTYLSPLLILLGVGTAIYFTTKKRGHDGKKKRSYSA